MRSAALIGLGLLAAVAMPAGAQPQVAAQPAATMQVLPQQSSTPIIAYLEQALIMRTAAPAATIVIGNPAIADVTLFDSQTLVITGRTYGATNLVVLGADHQTVANVWILVQAPQAFNLTVFMGTQRFTYSCGTLCQAAPIPGDAPSFFDEVLNQHTVRTGMAQAAGG